MPHQSLAEVLQKFTSGADAMEARRCCRRTTKTSELTSMCWATENGVAKQSSRRVIAGEITVSRFATLAAWFGAPFPSQTLVTSVPLIAAVWGQHVEGGTNHRTNARQLEPKWFAIPLDSSPRRSDSLGFFSPIQEHSPLFFLNCALQKKKSADARKKRPTVGHASP